MKTILEITPNFPGEVFINRHVESLIQLDYPIQVLTRQTAKKNLESASIAGKLEFSFKPKIFPKFQNLSPLDMLIILKQLVQLKNFPYSKSLFRDRVYLEYIKRLNPALIHFHFGSLAAFMNWMPQELGIPYTLSLRGSDIQVIPLLSEKNAKLFQEGINNAVGIHTVSDSLWKLAEPYLNHTIYHKTIYTTVPFVENLIARDGGDRGSEVIFVTVGRLHWIKNYVDLLKAFRRLLDTGLNAKLVIIGDGSEK